MLAPGVFSLQASIEIDGTPLGHVLEPLVEAVIVDDHLHLPSMFVLAFRDHTRTVLADAAIKIGTRIVIRGPAGAGKRDLPLITGEVTSIEAEYDSLGARAVVRGYDPSHRFHRGRRTATYINVTDADIAQTVATRAGVDVGTIESTTTTYEHVSQANMSDWEFLQSRARRIGYHVAFEDGKFQFRRPTRASGAPGEGDFESKDPVQMVMGQDLREFRPRITSSEQVDEVEIRAWDQVRREVMVVSKPASALSAQLSTDPVQIAHTFGAHRLVETSEAFSSESAVDAATGALAERTGSAFAEADGVMTGTTSLRAGTPFSVSVVGPDFTGGYVATSTRHLFDRDGYRTEFAVSGQQDRSLLGLVGAASTSGGSQPGRIEGVMVGLVSEVEDDLKLGRVKLKLPTLSADYVSDWARVVHPGAGKASGQVFLPDVGEEVLVAFEHGDISRPYVVGGLWSQPSPPPLGDALFDHGHNTRQGIVSRTDHKLVFFDGESNNGVALMTSDKGLRIALKATGTEIHIHSDGTIKIDSKGELEISSEGALKVHSAAQLTLEGSGGVTLKSSGVVELSGSQIKLN
jgi:phage protein D